MMLEQIHELGSAQINKDCLKDKALAFKKRLEIV